MNEAEQLVQETLRDYATRAPEFTSLRHASRRRPRWSFIAPLAGVAVAAAMVGLVIWFDPPTGETSGATPLPTTGEGITDPKSQLIPASPLSEQTLEQMQKRGIRASLLDPQDTQPPVSASEARAALAQEGSGEPGEMSLATVTVDAYLDRSGQRIIDNRMVWVALFPDTDVFLFGPIQGSEDRPAAHKADMIVMVDATSGKFLTAETIN